MADFSPDSPEKEQISLILKDADLKIERFNEYSFNSDFLKPTDAFSFTIGAEQLPDKVKYALNVGSAVTLAINDIVQASGYIDSIEIHASRGSGSTWRVEGRDLLAQAVDACAPPTQSLKAGQTLTDALKTLFKPFGWHREDQFEVSNEANRDVRTNKFRSKSKRSEAKGFGRRALKQYKIHQLRPYPRESVFDFASRLTQRFGLWLWCSADGRTLIVAEPDFDQEPTYKLFRNKSGTTNILDGSVKFDMSEQPTHIIADSYSGGGEFGKGVVKCILANTVMTAPEALDISQYVKAGAKVLGGPTFPVSSSVESPRTRVLYLHDDESQNAEQLEAFVRREMALLQRKSLVVHYTVEGHGQLINNIFVPWDVDTVVDVNDEVAGLREKLYVLSRTFNKSRSGGTTTNLELIRLNTLVFSDPSKTKST